MAKCFSKTENKLQQKPEASTVKINEIFHTNVKDKIYKP